LGVKMRYFVSFKVIADNKNSLEQRKTQNRVARLRHCRTSN